MKLKHYGYVLAIATALATILAAATVITRPALAIQKEIINPEQEPGEETTTHWFYTCIPEERDPHERDPVVRVHVTADFIGDDWKLTNFTVIHETYSGRQYDRGEQYAPQGFFGRYNQKDYLWIWNGKKKDEPEHVVTGGLFYNGNGEDNKWHYSERHEIQRKGKKPKISWLFTTCMEAKKGTG